MKATLHLLIFLCTTLLLHAQPIEWNLQPLQFSEINAVTYAGDNKWIVGGKSTSINGDKTILLYKVDTITQIQSSHNSFGYENIKSFFGNKNQFFSLTQKGNNEYINRVSQNTIANLSSGYTIENNEVVNDLVQLPNGTRVMVGYRMVNGEKMALLKIFSIAFALSYEDVFTKGYYSDIIVQNDSTFIVTGGIESSAIVGGRKYNQYHEMIEEILPNLESDHFMKSGDGGFFLVKDDEVTKLDQDMNILNTENFSSYGERLDLEVDDENIFMLFQKAGEAPVILKINNDLQIEDSFSIEDEFFIAKDMSLSEEEIGIGGLLIPDIPFNETPFAYTSTSGFFKTFSKNGISNTEDVDLEILDVKIKDHEKSPICDFVNIPETYSLNLKNVEVTFVNHGASKVINTTIFIQALGIDDCSNASPSPQYHFQQEELNLLRIEPGDTLGFRISAMDFPQAIADSTSVKLCIWNTEVDNKRDQNPSDNYFCEELDLNKAGYEEPPIIKPTEDEFLIFPNPIGNAMTVSLKQDPFERTYIDFYDQIGRNVQSYSIAPRASYKVFDTSHLSSGIYFVRIKNDLIDEVTKVYVYR